MQIGALNPSEEVSPLKEIKLRSLTKKEQLTIGRILCTQLSGIALTDEALSALLDKKKDAGELPMYMTALCTAACAGLASQPDKPTEEKLLEQMQQAPKIFSQMMRSFVLSRIADFACVASEVVEQVLHVLAAHPQGMRMDSLLTSVRALIPADERGDFTVLRLTMVIERVS